MARAATAKMGEHIRFVRPSDVMPAPIEWVWSGVLARGKLLLLTGDLSLGNSTSQIEIAARITTGRAMPCGTKQPVRTVILMMSEDDPAVLNRGAFGRLSSATVARHSPLVLPVKTNL